MEGNNLNVDTFKEVQRVIAANLNTPPENIRPDSQASNLPEWDSLRHLLIIMDIEQAFGFKFQLEEIGQLDSVPNILQAVEKRHGA